MNARSMAAQDIPVWAALPATPPCTGYEQADPWPRSASRTLP